MKKFLMILIAGVFVFPSVIFASDPERVSIVNSDVDPPQLSAYYDLRDRESYVQITNTSEENVTIHVQIFQSDRNCDELNFFDELTPNDTVIYDLDNIVRNNGSEVPVNLLDDSFGYVVVTDENFGLSTLIGNFRIIDNDGYEYRTNMAGRRGNVDNLIILDGPSELVAHFNTIDNANQADIVGYAYAQADSTTVINVDDGITFDIFVYDMDEEPLSCDQRTFACGAVMNYGVNEDYPASIGEDLLCPGGGLADPQGGFISFENGSFASDFDINIEPAAFVGLVGLNNGDGTGSMDYWFYQPDGVLM